MNQATMDQHVEVHAILTASVLVISYQEIVLHVTPDSMGISVLIYAQTTAMKTGVTSHLETVTLVRMDSTALSVNHLVVEDVKMDNVAKVMVIVIASVGGQEVHVTNVQANVLYVIPQDAQAVTLDIMDQPALIHVLATVQ